MNYGDTRPSQLAIFFFVAACIVLLLAGIIAYLLYALLPFKIEPNQQRVPSVFYLSTLALMVCSVLLHQSIQAVRREKQRIFRQKLLSAVIVGMLFLGMQGYGLYCVVLQADPADVVTGVLAFAFVCAVLHGLHVIVAMFFLIYVTLLSYASRYDHEYYWGIRYCSYFWHVLGTIWIIIFFIFVTIT